MVISRFKLMVKYMEHIDLLGYMYMDISLKEKLIIEIKLDIIIGLIILEKLLTNVIQEIGGMVLIILLVLKELFGIKVFLSGNLG